MRKKVGTTLEAQLLKRAKQVAVEEGKKLQEVFEEALQTYVIRHEGKRRGSMVRETAGIISLDPHTVQRLLKEEPGVLDT